jgi:hypothetical protein
MPVPVQAALGLALAGVLFAAGSSGACHLAAESRRGTVARRDGRWVAFSWRASNVVALDTNAKADVLLVHRADGTTTP